MKFNAMERKSSRRNTNGLFAFISQFISVYRWCLETEEISEEAENL